MIPVPQDGADRARRRGPCSTRPPKIQAYCGPNAFRPYDFRLQRNAQAAPISKPTTRFLRRGRKSPPKYGRHLREEHATRDAGSAPGAPSRIPLSPSRQRLAGPARYSVPSAPQNHRGSRLLLASASRLRAGRHTQDESRFLGREVSRDSCPRRPQSWCIGGSRLGGDGHLGVRGERPCPEGTAIFLSRISR